MTVVHLRSGTVDGWYTLQRYWWTATCEFADIAWQRRDKWPHERVLRGDIQRSVLNNPGFRLRLLFIRTESESAVVEKRGVTRNREHGRPRDDRERTVERVYSVYTVISSIVLSSGETF
jgi:hypothetical protein